MEIKCTVEEFKELIKNTPVAGTTDVNIELNPKKIIKRFNHSFLESGHISSITNHDNEPNNSKL